VAWWNAGQLVAGGDIELGDDGVRPAVLGAGADGQLSAKLPVGKAIFRSMT
jgi:hypothetical protein